MIRIPWDEHEQAVLLCSLIKVLNGELDRKRAVSEVSQQLREYAVAQGKTIDSKFRNENGIFLQMSKLEYVYTNGKSGLSVDTGWYFSVVKLYQEDRGRYKKLLGEVMETLTSEKSGKKNFHAWIITHEPMHAEKLFSSLNAISMLLLKNKMIHSPLLQMTDVSEIESLIREVRSNKKINIHSKSMKDLYIASLNTYRDYLCYFNPENDEHTGIEKNVNQVPIEQNIVETESAEASDLDVSDIENHPSKKLSFYEWLVKVKGLAETTGRGYDSAINIVDAFIRSHHIGHGMLRGVDDYKIVSETLDNLFQNAEFMELNQRQHNRYRAALRKYVQYVSGDFTIETKHREAIPEGDDEDIDDTPYRTILSRYFSKGFRIESRLDMGRFRVFWKAQYGAENEESDDIIRRRIAHITVRCRDFVYLPTEMASEQTTRRLFSYIFECFNDGKTAVYFDALFKEFQPEFAGKRMNNPEMLKQYLGFFNNGRFYIYKNYLTAEAEAKVDPADEVREYLIAAGSPVALEDIQDALSHLNADDVYWALAGRDSSEFVRNRKGEYFHADIIQLTQRELSTNTELIQYAKDEKEYIGGKELTDAIEVKLPAIQERYPFLTWLGLRDAIAYKLRDMFSFKGKIISSYGRDLSMSEVFAHFASTHDYFTLEQLNSLKRDLDTPIYFDSVYSNCLRINQDEFVSRNQAAFDIDATDAAISRFCTGDYVMLKEINFFGSFPDAGFPWNEFLLEHYVAEFSKKYKLMHLGFNAGMAVGAIVKRSSQIDDFDTLISMELAESSIPLDRDNALQFIVDIGLLARKHYNGIEKDLSAAKLLRLKKG